MINLKKKEMYVKEYGELTNSKCYDSKDVNQAVNNYRKYLINIIMSPHIYDKSVKDVLNKFDNIFGNFKEVDEK